MNTKIGVNLSLECMVDLYGHAGLLEKAVRMTQDMPSLDYSIMWHTIFSACKKVIDVNVGRWIKAMGELMFS